MKNLLLLPTLIARSAGVHVRKTTNRYAVVLVAISILSTAAAQSDNPGSLWSDAARNPLADRTARNVGDVLTVLVIEASSASATATTQSTKSDATRIEAGIGPILRALIPTWETGLDSQMRGTGATSRTGQLRARITVIVKQVLPNGNLLIEGARFVQMNKETQKIVLQGIVRPDDIRADNTILSENIAEATIRYDGKGTVGDRQRKGIISSLLDWLF